MRKLIVAEQISLDGVIQAPGGPQEDTSGDFRLGGGPRSRESRRSHGRVRRGAPDANGPQREDSVMNWNRLNQITLLTLRIVAGLLFLQAGGMKLFDWFGGIPADFGGHPAVMSQTWIAGVLEFYGGTAILLGLFTRPVALILSGEMAVAYFQFHQPNGAWPIQNHGEPAVLLCFIFLFFATHGGGRWSIDGLIASRKHGSSGSSAPVADP